MSHACFALNLRCSQLNRLSQLRCIMLLSIYLVIAMPIIALAEGIWHSVFIALSNHLGHEMVIKSEARFYQVLELNINPVPEEVERC